MDIPVQIGDGLFVMVIGSIGVAFLEKLVVTTGLWVILVLHVANSTYYYGV